MKKLNRDKVKLRNVLGIIDTPTHLDLLYEIVNFLDTEGREDGLFTTKELSLKTKVRVNEDIAQDLETLIYFKYVSKAKGKGAYKVVEHPW